MTTVQHWIHSACHIPNHDPNCRIWINKTHCPAPWLVPSHAEVLIARMRKADSDLPRAGTAFIFRGSWSKLQWTFGVWPLQFCWWLKDIKGMLYRGKSCSPENHRYWAVYKDSACHLCTKSQTSCKCLNLDLSFLILRKDIMFTFQLWSYGHLVGACCICWNICHRWHEVMPSISP